MMHKPIAALVTAGLIAIPLALSSQVRESALALPLTPTFGQPTVVGVQGYGFEEDVRVDTSSTSSRAIYTSSPNSLSSATSFLWRSTDAGLTFKWVPAAIQPNGKLTSCVGGGDSELATDTAGNLYYLDLTLANFTAGRSSDQGTTMTPSPCATVSDAAVDRQWYAAYGDPTNGGHLFLTYDKVAQSNPIQCPNGTSAAVGNNAMVFAQSPVSAAVGSTAGIEFAPSQPVSCDEGIMGNIESYKYSDHGLRAFAIHDNGALTSISMVRCDVVAVNPPTNTTGFSNCVDQLISSFPGSLNSGATGATGGDFPTLAIDSSGNLYAFWEQTDGSNDTLLKWSKSTNEGVTWSSPQTLSTPGLNTNVFAWPGAGDAGKVDVAWYGTAAKGASPDVVSGNWGLYMDQTLDGGATWSGPILTSQHFIHRGNIQTLIGGQSGDRTLGDFLQLRIGPDGRAVISYSDSNNIDEINLPQAMLVQQNGGSSVIGSGNVSGPTPPVDSVTDPTGDANFNSATMVGANQPNLDILGSSISKPDSTHYQVAMKVADLTSLGPDPNAGGPDLVWQTQWDVPSTTDTNGGKVFFVYMESDSGGTPTCWVGENAETLNGGGVLFTYPGATQLTGSACTYTATKPGFITITVPTSDVTEAGAIDNKLYDVIASTQSLAASPSSVPSVGGIGGVPFNLIDDSPTYTFNPSPTAVHVSYFRVREGKGHATFRWRLANPYGVLGFNLFAHRMRLNRAFIAAHRSRLYSFTWRHAAPGPFTLQTILRNGQEEVRVGSGTPVNKHRRHA